MTGGPIPLKAEQDREIGRLREALKQAVEGIEAAAHAGPDQRGIEGCNHCGFPWDGPHDEGCSVKRAFDIARAALTTEPSHD